MRLQLAAGTALLVCLALPARAAEPTQNDRKSGFVTLADGAKIHYVEAGQGQAVLFIPGWTVPASIWDGQVAHFSRGHRAVTIDPRSQGQSTKTPEGSYPAARARDLKGVIDQLGLAPVALVCWSAAVQECLSYVDQFGTGAVSAIALVDGISGGAFPPERMNGFLRWVTGFQKDRRAQADGFVRSMFRKPPPEATIRQLVEGSLATPTDTAVALVIAAMVDDERPALAKLDKPALIAVTQNPWMPVYQEMKAKVPQARFEVFAEAGHALFVDEPERFARLVEELLAPPAKSP